MLLLILFSCVVLNNCVPMMLKTHRNLTNTKNTGQMLKTHRNLTNTKHTVIPFYKHGCCRFDGWTAKNHGYLSIIQCNDICVSDNGCIAFDMARPKGRNYDCYTFYGSGNNFRTECGGSSSNGFCFKKKEEEAATEEEETVPQNGLYSWFKPSSAKAAWSSSIGNWQGVASGTVPTVVTEAGNGASVPITYLTGTINSRYYFGAIVPATFTICSTSRYLATNSGARILQSKGNNWFHGHWNGFAGMNYYEGWNIDAQVKYRVSPKTDWLIMCGSSDITQQIYVNGEAKGFRTGAASPADGNLWINPGSESSDWAVAEIITWDRVLTVTEIEEVSANMRKELSDNCPIVVGQDVNGGFAPLPESDQVAASDEVCQSRCNSNSKCTAWVRSPSKGVCWLSKQTGTVQWTQRNDRNGGLRCGGGSGYYLMDRGTCCCPSAKKIQDKAECIAASISLDLSSYGQSTFYKTECIASTTAWFFYQVCRD